MAKGDSSTSTPNNAYQGFFRPGAGIAYNPTQAGGSLGSSNPIRTGSSPNYGSSMNNNGMNFNQPMGQTSLGFGSPGLMNGFMGSIGGGNFNSMPMPMTNQMPGIGGAMMNQGIPPQGNIAYDPGQGLLQRYLSGQFNPTQQAQPQLRTNYLA